jgi:hypothetical protein
MAVPTLHNDKLPRGDTWTLEVEITGQDLSGWTWACMWREDPSDPDPLTTATVNTDDAEDGLVTFTVPASFTGTLTPPQIVYYDVQRTASGVVETVVKGILTVEWDVTR